jgi:hypothetical protein
MSPHRRQIQRDRDIEIIHAATMAGELFFNRRAINPSAAAPQI